MSEDGDDGGEGDCVGDDGGVGRGLARLELAF